MRPAIVSGIVNGPGTHWSAIYWPFLASHLHGTKPPCWRAKVALGQDQQNLTAYIVLNGNFLCLSCPSATFALQHGGFVPREWLAAKGLLVTVPEVVANVH